MSIQIYEAAKKDAAYVSDIKATGQSMPGFFACKVEKAVCGAGYCGWLIGKYGPSKANEMYEEIING